MHATKIALAFAVLLICFAAQAQPSEFNKIFHPQTQENIEVMKKSPQKIVFIYAAWGGATMENDSDNFLQHEKHYDNEGRLVLHKNTLSHNQMNYKYDKKGRVIEYLQEYFDDNAKAQPILHFSIKYTKKGGIKAVTNLNKRGKSISFNSNTKMLLISDASGYIYRFVTDERGRLTKTKTEYYQSTRYSSTLTYTKKGLLLNETGTKEASTPYQPNIKFTIRYTYTKGLLTEKSSEAKKEVYTYQNNLLVDRAITAKGKTMSYHYTYDEQQRLAEVIYKERDAMLGKEVYSYR